MFDSAKSVNPFNRNNSILKTCFDLNERASYCQLLREFQLNKTSNSKFKTVLTNNANFSLTNRTIALESTLNELKSLESAVYSNGGGATPNSSCSPNNLSPSSTSTFNSLLLKRRALFSSRLGFDLEEKRRYQRLLEMQKLKFGDYYNSQNRTDSSLSSTANSCPQIRQRLESSSSIVHTPCSYDEHRFGTMLDQTRRSLDSLHQNFAPIMIESSSRDNLSGEKHGNGFVQTVAIENDGVLSSESEAECSAESPKPCCSNDLQENRAPLNDNMKYSRNPSLRRLNFDRLSEKFKQDPAKLCHEIRSEYKPLSEIRKSEAERLLIEAKLRLEAIVNFYFTLITDRGGKNDLPSCYAFNTFFLPKLMKDGYTALKRWTRKVNIFSFDLILVPVHLGVHWCLAVIDFRTKSIAYYDSMGGTNFKATAALLEYLAAESLDKRKVAFDTSDWQEIMMEAIPHQMNGSDCGVFTCKFADYVSRDKSINFDQ
uniref:Ubiquitin-like protease family profile domain-containing protein n=1 Tax=Romanomermis culicivorax TaxID=13658 RepID=A0A915JKN3_ROMCU